MTQDPHRTFTAKTASVHLRLLGMTDLHGHLRGFDYETGHAADGVGLARLATLIRSARSECANCLLFDNGDTIQGTAMTDWAAAHVTQSKAHPMIEALNVLNVDAATIGNHEFNFGLEVLQDSYDAARFSVVCANVLTHRGDTPEDDITLFPAWDILTRRVTDADGEEHKLRIGVTGVLPPQIMQWDYRHLTGHVETRGILEALAHHVPAMHAAGADVVVVLCHSGLATPEDGQSTENTAQGVAAMPGVDAVIAGHTHQRFPSPDFASLPSADLSQGTVAGTPLVLPGSWGSHLGVIDLTLKHRKGRWKVQKGQGVLWPDADALSGGQPEVVPEDKTLVRCSAPAHRATLSHVAQPVGTAMTRMHTYFSVLEPTAALSVVALAQTKAAGALLEGTEHRHLPILSAVCPFKNGGRSGPNHYTDVDAGELTLQHITDLYLYPNSLSVVGATGAVVRNWLERAAGQYQQIQPGLPAQPLIDPALAGYDFDCIYGLTYRFDLTQPSRYTAATGQVANPGATRVVDLRWNGRPVRDEDMFAVATNSYRAGGGGHFPGLSNDLVVAETETTVRDFLISYLNETRAPIPTQKVWQFCAIPGATVLFDTSPKARTVPEDMSRLGLSDIGDRASGFAVFEYDMANGPLSAGD